MNDQQILESLLEQGHVDKDQCLIAKTENRRSGKGVREILLQNGFVGQDIFTQMYGHSAGVEVVDLKNLMPDEGALALLPVDLARQLMALPINYCKRREELHVCVVNPDDVILLDRLRKTIPSHIELLLGISTQEQILSALDRFYGFELSIDGILLELEGAQTDGVNNEALVVESAHPLVRLTDAFLSDACKHSASDIHFEPEPGYLRVRYRIDGVLRTVASIHKKYWAGCSTRLKVLAGLNIAETRAAQDGAFSMTYAMRSVDIRVSIFPTMNGENIVLRLLSSSAEVASVAELGFSAAQLLRLNQAIGQPFGLNLVVGPTGSGKTTTLYAILQSISDERVNIMTLEDPVECVLPLFRQCSVNSRVKMNFADGIRSVLRQDPDVILIGEIRDRETADLAFRAAMTGHQVFATVHASSALGAYHRLFELGLSRELVSQQVNSVIAQRLMRLLCPYCKEPDATTIDPSDSSFFRAAGCHHCEEQGYKGRTVTAEILLYDQQLAQLIERGADTLLVRERLLSTGFESIEEASMRILHQGLTSQDEVLRVCGPFCATWS